MAANFWGFDEKKTEITIFGCSTADFSAGFLGPHTPDVSSPVKNPIGIFDDKLKFDCELPSLSKTAFINRGFYQKGYLSHRDLETVIHAFIYT